MTFSFTVQGVQGKLHMECRVYRAWPSRAVYPMVHDVVQRIWMACWPGSVGGTHSSTCRCRQTALVNNSSRVAHLAAGLDIKGCNAGLGGDIQMEMVGATCKVSMLM